MHLVTWHRIVGGGCPDKIRECGPLLVRGLGAEGGDREVGEPLRQTHLAIYLHTCAFINQCGWNQKQRRKEKAWFLCLTREGHFPISIFIYSRSYIYIFFILLYYPSSSWNHHSTLSPMLTFMGYFKNFFFKIGFFFKYNFNKYYFILKNNFF